MSTQYISETLSLSISKFFNTYCTYTFDLVKLLSRIHTRSLMYGNVSFHSFASLTLLKIDNIHSLHIDQMSLKSKSFNRTDLLCFFFDSDLHRPRPSVLLLYSLPTHLFIFITIFSFTLYLCETYKLKKNTNIFTHDVRENQVNMEF